MRFILFLSPPANIDCHQQISSLAKLFWASALIKPAAQQQPSILLPALQYSQNHALLPDALPCPGISHLATWHFIKYPHILPNIPAVYQMSWICNNSQGRWFWQNDLITLYNSLNSWLPPSTHSVRALSWCFIPSDLAVESISLQCNHTKGRCSCQNDLMAAVASWVDGDLWLQYSHNAITQEGDAP